MADRSIFDLDVTRNEFAMQGQGEATSSVTAVIAVTTIGVTFGCVIIGSYFTKCFK